MYATRTEFFATRRTLHKLDQAVRRVKAFIFRAVEKYATTRPWQTSQFETPSSLFRNLAQPKANLSRSGKRKLPKGRLPYGSV